MNERLEAIKSSILDSLDKAKTALNNKDVKVESLKVSEIPGYIRQIELNKIKLTINCSEFEGGTIKAKKDGKERAGTVQDGQCIIMLPSTGTWHIEHDLGDYVETEVNGNTSVELVKKKVTFSEVECSEEKITIHVDSVTGNNSNDNFIRVKKNGVVIEVQAQLKGSDIEITNFEYEEGATYTIEYVIKDEVRGSVNVLAINKNAYTVDESKGPLDDVYQLDMFNNYPDYPTNIVFTDQKAPDNVTTYGWSKDGSKGIVKWLDSDTNTLYISTQKEGQKIIWNKLPKYIFVGSGGMGPPDNKKTKSIDVFNLDTSGMESFYNMFANLSALTEIKNLQNLDTSKATLFNSMFSGCHSIQELDLSGFKVDQVTSFNMMFLTCNKLQTIYASEWANNAKVTGSKAQLFSNCISLPNFESSNITIDFAKWKENGGYFTNPAEKG